MRLILCAVFIGDTRLPTQYQSIELTSITHLCRTAYKAPVKQWRRNYAQQIRSRILCRTADAGKCQVRRAHDAGKPCANLGTASHKIFV